MFVRSCWAAQSAAYSLFCCMLQAAGAWFTPLSTSGTRCAVLGSVALGGTRPSLPLNARLPSLHCKQMGCSPPPLVRSQQRWHRQRYQGHGDAGRAPCTATRVCCKSPTTNPRDLCKCVVAQASTQCSVLTYLPCFGQSPVAAWLGLLVVQARKLVIHLRHAC